MKFDTSNIVKRRIISDYERKYGKGGEAKMYFAFRFIPLYSVFMAIIIIATIVGYFLSGKEILIVFGAVMPFISAPLTFMLGYLYGDKKSD